MVKVVNNQDEANCITHSGTMHADEVFATAFLELFLGEVRVYRTTSIDTYKLDSNTLVYDIGRGKFDHHQNDALKRENGITYSSFGLLWKEYGKVFLENNNYENVLEMYNAIDKDLVEGIDADDNGLFPKIETFANYKVKTVSNIIKLFNPSFNSKENESEQFIKAVNVARQILEEEILYINGKVIAEEKVIDYIDKLDEGTKYLILEEFLPYEEAILNNSKANELLFVAFPSNRGGYAIKTIPKSINEKSSRMSFPEEWAGLSNEELENTSGIKGLRFCHTGRFIVNCNDIDVVYKVLNALCK